MVIKSSTSHSRPTGIRRRRLLGLTLLLLGLATALAAAADEPEKKRVVIRTNADGKVEVVGADEASSSESATTDDKETKDRKAIEAMAQRLWTADTAEQSLDRAGQGNRPKTAAAPATPKTSPMGSRRLALRPRTEASAQDAAKQPTRLGQSGTAAGLAGSSAESNIVPCLANRDDTSDIDPCEVARRIGRLEPCRNPDECAAYEAWRRQYGAPGLRAASPRAADGADDPADSKPDPR